MAADVTGGHGTGWDPGAGPGPERNQGPERPIRVLVADDQTVVREGLKLILSLSPGITVVGTAADREDAVRLVGERGPDVVLMDLRMPRLDGIAATRRIARAFPATRVVVLTTYADDASIFGALEAGALGYLTKGAGAQEIQQAIRTVHAGEALLDPAVQVRVIRAAVGHGAGHGAPPPQTAASLPDDLTPREGEVLRLIAQGRNNQEIAVCLVVTEGTVKTHINNIFSKAGLRDRAQAVVYAITHGLAGEVGAGENPGRPGPRRAATHGRAGRLGSRSGHGPHSDSVSTWTIIPGRKSFIRTACMGLSLEGDETMFEGFTLDRVDTGEAVLTVHYGGSGPPVLLLHGHPRTHATWHRVAPLLARHYTAQN